MSTNLPSDRTGVYLIKYCPVCKRTTKHNVAPKTAKTSCRRCAKKGAFLG